MGKFKILGSSYPYIGENTISYPLNPMEWKRTNCQLKIPSPLSVKVQTSHTVFKLSAAFESKKGWEQIDYYNINSLAYDRVWRLSKIRYLLLFSSLH